MKQYLLSVHGVEGEPTPAPEVIERMYATVDVSNKKLMANGNWVFGGGLHPANTATVVRNEGGKVTMTDGPFVEAKEQLGGFWILKAADLDAALALVTQASEACGGPVEVRPFQDEPGA